MSSWQSSCGSTKSFSTRYQAEAEHKRLKKQTATASTSGSNGARWCANKYRFWSLSSWQEGCGSSSAKSFSSKYQAEAEHKRLKKQTTTASTSGSKSVWCASASSVYWITEASCKYRQLKGFPTKAQAQAEHKWLKGIATASAPQPTPQPEPEPVQTTTVDNSALDLEFWKSIKESNDPDMYRAYLRKFPSGVYAGLAKLKIKKTWW